MRERKMNKIDLYYKVESLIYNDIDMNDDYYNDLEKDLNDLNLDYNDSLDLISDVLYNDQNYDNQTRSLMIQSIFNIMIKD